MDVLDRLSVVFVGLEHLNLEGMIGAFVEVDERSARDQLRGYPCLFLNEGELLWAVVGEWADVTLSSLSAAASTDSPGSTFPPKPLYL